MHRCVSRMSRVRKRACALAAMLVALVSPIRQAGAADGPAVVIVEAHYPNADARTVAETVAAPIEQQLLGAEFVASLGSRSGPEGSYVLEVHVPSGRDLDRALSLIRDRVALAEPALPGAVRRAGVSVRKALPDPRALVVIAAPGGDRDLLFLGKLAAGTVRDQLLHVPGVGDVSTIGRASLEARFWCDATRLAAFDVSAAEVARVVAGAKAEPAVANALEVDRPEQPRQARLPDADALGQLVAKTFANGNIVRLADLGRIELGRSRPTWASRDGQPIVALVIRPTPEAQAPTVWSALRTAVAGAAAAAPEGVRLELLELSEPAPGPARAGEPAPLVIVDFDWPAAMSLGDVQATIERCGAMARDIPGVVRALAFSSPLGDPARDRPVLLLELTPECAHGERRQALHAALQRLWDERVPGLTYRMGAAGTPAGLTLAVCDRGDHGLEALRAQATVVVEALSRCPELASARLDRSAEPVPEFALEVDRPKAAALGVAPEAVVAAARLALGPLIFGAEPPAAASSLVARPPTEGGADLETILRTPVGNDAGLRVPLSALAQIRHQLVPGEITRFDGQPMIAIGAEPAPGVSPAQARAACDRQVRDIALPDGYRLVRLPDSG